MNGVVAVFAKLVAYGAPEVLSGREDPMTGLSTAAVLGLFLVASLATFAAELVLADTTNVLDDRFGLGEPLGGLILLGIAGTSPEIAITQESGRSGPGDREPSGRHRHADFVRSSVHQTLAPDPIRCSARGDRAQVIVDSHCHASQAWYGPVESLVYEMDRNGVERAILIQIAGEYDNSYQLACVRQHPDPLASVVHLDAATAAAPAELERLAVAGAVGVRLGASIRTPGDDPLAIWRTAGRLGLAVSCYRSGTDPSLVEEIVTTLPDLRLVLEHFTGRAENEHRRRAQPPRARSKCLRQNHRAGRIRSTRATGPPSVSIRGTDSGQSRADVCRVRPGQNNVGQRLSACCQSRGLRQRAGALPRTIRQQTIHRTGPHVRRRR